MSTENSISHPVSDPMPGGLLSHRSNGLAFAEGALLLGSLVLLDHSGIFPFEMSPVHPFLFAIILLSAQYGLQGGMLAAMGATLLSLIDGGPARPIDMSYADYFRMAWGDILSWMLAALSVGIVTSHRCRVIEEQATRLSKAITAERLIAAQYEVLAQRTHKLERSLAGRADARPAEPEPPLAVIPEPQAGAAE
jgi:thiamine transporter ThiT